MTLRFILRRIAFSFCLLTTTLHAEEPAKISLLCDIAIPGTASDLSNLTETLSDGTPANRLGGPSGLSWTGRGLEFLWITDRGPLDGATTHTPRYHVADLKPCLDASGEPILKRTVLLRDRQGRPLSGSSAAFDKERPENSLRFDSEGIALRNGSVIVSEEYGPVVREFDENGKAQRDWPVPAKFAISNPSASEEQEFAENATGRLTNAGFEGLCIDSEGQLLAALQRPLRQDGAYDEAGQRVGRNVRLLQMCGPDCKPREFVYVLDDPKQGISELCHVGGTTYLAIERDSTVGETAQAKKITIFDISRATDVSDTPRLPSQGLPASIVPVRKTVLIDLLDPAFGLAGAKFPEKIEGLSFGPKLADGRRLLVVATDNDFEAAEPIRFWFFAVAEPLLKND
ncbi:hypothetical protein GC170_17945 [bacterium]|nr:hypothetical protein [bacterium]